MNDFTASNGATVTLRDYRHFDAVSVSTADKAYDLAGVHTQALREFFQAEADERLGRWRWPADPEFVVYPEGDMVCVTNERTGHGNVFGRQWYEDHKSGLLAKEQPGVYAAAGAYFDAHPEPKPLPEEPGLYTGAHIDGQPSVWWRHGDGSWLLVNHNASYSGTELADIEKYAPFERMVAEVS